MDIWVASLSWLLCTVLQWTQACLYLFQLEFSQDTCPGVGLLGHMVAVLLAFWGTPYCFPLWLHQFASQQQCRRPLSPHASSIPRLWTWWWPFWLAWGDTSLQFCFSSLYFKLTGPACLSFPLLVPEKTFLLFHLQPSLCTDSILHLTVFQTRASVLATPLKRFMTLGKSLDLSCVSGAITATCRAAVRTTEILHLESIGEWFPTEDLSASPHPSCRNPGANNTCAACRDLQEDGK